MPSAPASALVPAVLAEYGGAARELLFRYLPRSEPRRHLYDLMVDYPSRGGRAFRPSLCIATARAFGASLDDALCSAVSIELLHNAMLIHDDIEDESLERRGRPALHVLHGVPIALNTGDALALRSLRPLIDNRDRLGARLSLRILEETERTAQETAEGQALELGWRRDNAAHVREADYLEMVLKKTAWLTTIHPLRVGALIGTRGSADLVPFVRFGFLLGAAFQIQDDVLNLIGNAASYGKELDGDIREGKRTLMLIHLFEHSDADERARLEALLALPREQRSDDDVRWVRRRMDDRGSIEAARRSASALAGAAQHEFSLAFAGVRPSRDRDFIEALPTWVIERSLAVASAPPFRSLLPLPLMRPPMTFDAVAVRAFPLRADPARLQAFCDQHFNELPTEAGRFRVAAPFVSLLLMRYGRMHPASAPELWTEQTEAVFCIGAEWLRPRQGKLVFYDWACLTPLLFVSSTLSVVMGRELYGWPKMLARFDLDLGEPGADPPSPVRGSIRCQGVLPGVEVPERPVLDILPPGSAGPARPASLSSLASAFSSFDLTSAPAAVARALRALFSGSLPGYGTLNRRVVAAADGEGPPCYEAVLNGRMELHRQHGAGYLGRPSPSDLSAGYRLRLHRLPECDLVAQLGLEARPVSDRAVELVPVLPFWGHYDLHYRAPEVVAWRASTGGHQGPWHTHSGARRLPPQPPLQLRAEGQPEGKAEGGERASMIVAPLLADAAALGRLCDRLYNEPLQAAGERVEPLGSWVFFVATRRTQEARSRLGAPPPEDHEITLLLPARWLRAAPDGSLRPHRIVHLPLLAFDTSYPAVLRGWEGLGVPMGFAFTTPHASLADRDGAPWLDVYTDLVEGRGLLRKKHLLSFTSGPPLDPLATAPALVEPHDRDASLTLLTLKQLHNPAAIGTAAYQALVSYPRRLALQAPPEPARVELRLFPTEACDLASALGLRVERLAPGVERIEAEAARRLSVRLLDGPGRERCVRAGTERWSRVAD